jgi:branched-chain amino acid transport system substrate-binding protein
MLLTVGYRRLYTVVFILYIPYTDSPINLGISPMKLVHKLALGTVALSIAAASFAADTIKIGLQGPLTGGSSPMGVSMRDGAKLAVNEINAKGGIMGRKIEMIERDDEAKNERGVQIAQELINKEKVVATVGYINSGVALASQRFYQEAKIPVMNNVATASVITKQFADQPENYVFRNSANDTIQSGMIVEELISRRKYTKVAILADATNYGQLGREDLEKALKAKGITAVAIEKYNIKDVDMTPQLLKAKDAGAQVVITYGIGPELAQIANGMVKLGWKVPMMGSWTLSMANFLDNAGPNADGAVMPQTFIQEGNTPKRKSFIEAYQKAYKVKRIPSPVSAAQGYDSVYLLAAAMKQAKSTDGPAVLKALEDLKDPVEGVVTTYNKPFSKEDHEAITANMVVIGAAKDGVINYAYDEDKKKGGEVRTKAAAKAAPAKK